MLDYRLSQDSDHARGMQTLPDSLPVQVTFKGTPEGLRLIIPQGLDWEEVRCQLQQRLSAGERLWQTGAGVILEAGERLLDGQQLLVMEELLTAQQLRLIKVCTSRRQTAVAAAVAGHSVDQATQKADTQSFTEPLYVQTTMRSGMQLVHAGTIVVIGDVNPGAELIADGDILVWGALRGLAHAGASGNGKALIFALKLRPTQLRIAERVARSPDEAPVTPQPEVAYVRDSAIHIALATEFARRHLT
ncbi:MAG: septum site-determining protein MinC [Gemmatimonadaceae bacterium]|nr:septum site-determining protein MinC [Gloeobacterales cyanobacterium ES-bin-141]